MYIKALINLPKDNILSTQDIEDITFIKNYAEAHAESFPGRLSNHKNYKVVKLPSVDSKLLVFRKYL